MSLCSSMTSLLLEMQTFIEIKKTSRTGRYGRDIKCPHCGTVKKVYHFAWSAVGCQGCGKMVEKYDFLMEAK